MEETANKSIGINLVKTITFLVISLLLVAGTFFLEYVHGKEVEEEKEVDIFPERSVVRFDNEFSNPSFDLKKKDDDGYIFEFEEGRFWANFSVSPDNVNILVDNVTVIPNRAAFDLSYDGTQFELAVYDGDVYLGFVRDEIEITNVSDAFDDIFMNRILVPINTQVRFNIRQITPEIEPLLYSKLIKELRLTTISDARRSEGWVESNRRQDIRFVEEIRQDLLSGIVRVGVPVRDSFFGELMFFAEEKLTFVPDKKRTRTFERLFNYLDAAAFHAVSGDRDEVAASMASFESYHASLPANIAESEEYHERLNEYMEDFYIFGPRHSLHDIWRKLADKKFALGMDRYEIVNLYWLDVYKAMSVGEEDAALAFERYYSYFDRVVGLPADEDFYLNYLFYQNQLLDSLLLRTNVFYRDAYFEIKNVFEQILLELYPEGRFKEELRQFFISNKINLMRRLRAVFFEGEITADEASVIFGRLISEAKDFMPVEDTGVAVVRLFQSQLEDITDFWGYLRSQQYHVRAYGATHEERYEFYLVERDLIRGVDELVRDVFDEEPEELTLDEVKREIEEIISTHEDVFSVEVVRMDTPDQRNVDIAGVIGGYRFEAVYDRYQDSIRDVYVYGELISARPIKIDGLRSLLEIEFEDLAEEVEPIDDVTVDTVAQRVARRNIAETLQNYGFVVDTDDVSVVDRYHLSYRLEDIVLEGFENIEVTFDLMISGGEIVTNLFMRVYGEPKAFEGNFTIADVVEMVKFEDELYRSPPPVEESPDVEEEDVRILR